VIECYMTRIGGNRLGIYDGWECNRGDNLSYGDDEIP